MENQESLLQAIKRLGRHDHICLIYENQRDQFAKVIPYIKIGFKRSERCKYIIDENTKSQVAEGMQKDGIDLTKALENKSLIFATKNETYLKGGKFDPDAFIDLLAKDAIDAKRDGFKSLRVAGEMTWTLGDEPGNDRLLEYEAKLNYFLPKYDISLICQYYKDKFPPTLIKDIIYTHPIVAYNGWVYKNFYYIPPQNFLDKNTDEAKVRHILNNIQTTEEAIEQQFQALKRFEIIFMQLPSAVVVAEASTGRLIIANKRMDEIWKQPFIKLANISEYRLYTGFHNDGRKYKVDEWPLARSLLKGETVNNEEIKILRGDKTYGCISVSSAPIRDNDGNIFAAVTTFTDITEKKEQERQKDEFIGVVSHELKTPVTSLKAFTQVLQNRFAKEQNMDAALYFEKMDTQINKLIVLIGDLLDVTKIEAGKIKLNNQQFDMDSLVREIVEEVQLTTKHRIIIRGKTGKQVFGDRERIGQVLINLLSNAIKYSPSALKIIVKLSLSNSSITCSVQDFGNGIDKKNQEKLFERFYRVSGDKELTYPGLGLGLYISKEIILRQGGKIWVKSKKGKGSIFSFSVPFLKKTIEIHQPSKSLMDN